MKQKLSGRATAGRRPRRRHRTTYRVKLWALPEGLGFDVGHGVRSFEAFEEARDFAVGEVERGIAELSRLADALRGAETLADADLRWYENFVTEAPPPA